MATVSGLSTSLINAYRLFQSTNSLSTKDMFKGLSLDVGGDGAKITKKQLDQYIKDAESGKTKVSSDKLDAVKYMQENWDKISNGKDSITADDMKKYSSVLVKTVLDGLQTSSDSNSKVSVIDDVDQYLIQSALGTSADKASTSDLNSYLKTLLTGTTDEKDDSNANLIATLTNLIANRNKISTVETEA